MVELTLSYCNSIQMCLNLRRKVTRIGLESLWTRPEFLAAKKEQSWVSFGGIKDANLVFVKIPFLFPNAFGAGTVFYEWHQLSLDGILFSFLL
jgi:hypothetical protein